MTPEMVLEPIPKMARFRIFTWSIIDEGQTGNAGRSQINNSVASGDKVDIGEFRNSGRHRCKLREAPIAVKPPDDANFVMPPVVTEPIGEPRIRLEYENPLAFQIFECTADV